MYQGKHVKKSKHSKGKRLIVATVLAVTALTAVGSSLAYINHSTGSVINRFTPSSISCEIEETVESGVKKSVKIQNTGKTEAYVRVAVIANTVDASGKVTGAADVSTYLAGSGWVKSGMYYYYQQPVAPNAKTGELLKSDIELDGIQVTILAEAIQSEPAEAALDAWGVSPATLK